MVGASSSVYREKKGHFEVVKRQLRLREHDRFVQVRRQGRAWAGHCCVIVALPNQLDHSRFGFSVSKRVGKAVRRNKVRRRLREIVRHHVAQIRPGWDIVIIARPAANTENYTTLQETLLSLFRRANLWIEAPEKVEKP